MLYKHILENSKEMIKLRDAIRKDSWTDSDDSILAEIVLEYVRTGKAQTRGFEAASERLNRSPAACGFRWNSEVRKRYEDDLIKAKEDRKQLKSESSNVVPSIVEEQEAESIAPPETVVHPDPLELLGKAVEAVALAYRQLQRENDKLKRQLQDMPQQEDIVALMELLNRAKNLGLLNNKSAAV